MIDVQHFWLESDFVMELLKQLPAYVFWKDKNSVYLGCNHAFSDSLGLSSPEEIVGKTDYDLPTKKEESDAFRLDDQQVLADKKPKLNIEEYQTRLDGRKVVLLTNKVPLLDKHSKVIGILGIYYDITRRKQREEELREAKEKAEMASRTKTEFLENMRHDIRTPLVGMVGLAELINMEVQDPKIKGYATNLVASGHALTNLLNEVLETIHVSSGEIPLLKKKFILQKKLNDVIELHRAIAHHKKIHLSFDYDPNIPHYLIGDPTRIHRVVLELVTNALNFTHQGSVHLTASLAKNNEDDVVIKMMVEDTGIGIPLEKQQDIYLQFKRLTPSYEGIYKGHGLGLSIAKQLIEDLKGELYVESQSGIGSTFVVVVKLKKALLEEDLGSEDVIPVVTRYQSIPPTEFALETSAETSVCSYKSHILVVEDSPIAAHVLECMLSSMGCTVDIAEKGKEAIDLAEQTPYDLIFMDIGLPDIDGYEVTKRIRRNNQKKKHVPIIALTAHASEENKEYCMEIGMNAVLTKPLAQKKAEALLNSFIPSRKDNFHMKRILNPLEASTPDHSISIFDFDRLKEHCGQDEKVAIEMATLFLKTLPQELHDIQAAYTKKDWTYIQKLTHKLKGGVSYCGGLRLKEACSQLEKAIRNGEKEYFENFYNQLLKEITLIEKTMTEKIF